MIYRLKYFTLFRYVWWRWSAIFVYDICFGVVQIVNRYSYLNSIAVTFFINTTAVKITHSCWSSWKAITVRTQKRHFSGYLKSFKHTTNTFVSKWPSKIIWIFIPIKRKLSVNIKWDIWVLIEHNTELLYHLMDLYATMCFTVSQTVLWKSKMIYTIR